MYSRDELSRLAVLKAALRQRIGARRLDCARSFAGVARPLAWLDRVQALWRQVSPLVKLAAVPLAFGAGRRFIPKAGRLGSLLRWAPMAFGLVRAWGSLSRARR
jgi:hypothetical protein